MPSEQKIIVIPDGKICDYIDGKFRNDTPEEYVRQTIEKRLVNEHKYLPEQIRIEYTLQVGSNKPRADIVIWEEGADQTQGTIKLIIECKKETVDARNAKDGIAQLKSYMSVCPNCEWGMWTNSVQKYVFRKAVDAAGNITFMEYNDIPAADGNLDEVNRPSRTSLKNAYDDNLLFVFKTCHNHIYVNDGMQKQPAFFELLKVIFCKIEDERNIPNPLEFYTTSEERSNPDGQLTVQKRIGKIFQRVKKRHGKIFDANDEIKLSPRSLAYIVSELQRYSLLNTKIDIKGKAYEEIVGAMVMNNDGSGNILQTNSLLPPHEWYDDFRSRLAEALGINKNTLRNHSSIGYFNVIVTNPPFGSKIPIKDKNILEQFELAHIWDCDKETGVWKKTSRLQSSVPPEILFIERCTQFLAPGGRMGIVLPDSILGSPGLGYIREWIIQNHRIVASIDLNADTFQPRNGTQTSVLILQKKTQEQRDAEEKSGKMADYNIFMAMVEKVGHDKRGNPLFKRDKEGNEILVPDTNSVLVLGETGEGQRTVSHEQKVKVEDDQTPDVPAIFAEWKRQEGLGW
ncbi:type I restriction enzyme HsdR N-terminal domain-containing protein [Flavonifractor plautii]|uniref:type I restriction enzyme HsdR N-terminal domain-containing protein n=1 Tax=Flavonifractor plautii TaxID=292800 RepID=UPI002331418E|nr:type I restriction enzyme HsdR N-terminal domain-containing protein [Flavonifractor plautii]MDB7921947.1 type I restriction enzyme HsdR N-terminal domain-containing protein [Flavonifractor plautii]MDB7942144.1 type I restriction enzyme HsdR N-terminal domain-containing protein [Flavonifractor plautii]